jgi:hypothetical protein
MLEWVASDGKINSMQCEKLCKTQLATQGLVEREGASRWKASSYASEWLTNQDNLFLAVQLHSNVKFFGELIASIGEDTKHSDLVDIARESYGLNWNSADQVRRRTGWMRSLGLIEVWGQKVVRTGLGDEFLRRVSVCTPEEATGDSVQSEDSLSDSQMKVISDLTQFEQVDLRNRKALIGYIPRGNATAGSESESLGATEAVRKLVGMIGKGITVDDFFEECSSDLGISKSSFTSTMHALRHTNLIEQTAFNFYSQSQNAEMLVRAGNEKLLAAYLHGRYLYFCEILNYLDEPSTPSALVSIAKDQYGFNQANNGEIRVRLEFLQDAGLVERIDWQRFRITVAGKQFRELLPMQKPVIEGRDAEVVEEGEADLESSSIHAVIIEDLRTYGTNGKASSEFERAVSRAFAFLGFETEHLGGPGRTDVLCVAQLATSDRYRVIVDAKSSGNGIVDEGGLTFDVLRDHKKKHKADYIVVVGPGFAPRLKNWALENRVILLTIDDLTSIVALQVENPVSLSDLREMLSRVDTFKDDLIDRFQTLERRSSLMRKIVDLAFQEVVDEDPIDDGFISIENVVYALRKEFSPRPSLDEVREVLEFLSNPVVGALVSSKGRYRMVDAPRNLQLRLHGLGHTTGID